MLDAWLDLAHGAACAACLEPGRLLCRACDGDLPADGYQVWPDPCPVGLAPAFACGEYAGPLRALIVAHKEHRAFALARPLGRLLAGALEGGLGGVVSTGSTTGGGSTAEGVRVLLVPVPSRPSVVRARGHDPMLRVTRFAATRLRARGSDVRVLSLVRQRELVADQAGLTALARAANLADSMAADRAALAGAARVRRRTVAFLCDDVITTGSTAREAQRALEDVGVPLGAIACIAATRKRVGAGHWQ
ncbi:MAG: pyrE 1 [Marmoricola sp.]|nr:pyrE 1 [Marmoricola sp.]